MGNFQKVTRLKSKLRLALTGVSGAGKTLGALYIAYGITEDWGKIALIDTEHERGRLYANREDLGTGEFLYAAMEPPYHPQKYINLVHEAAAEIGEDGVIIIDSFSHAWNNEGGVLDLKDEIAAKEKGTNGFTAWNKAGKIQNNLVNIILSANCHTIVTMRSKMEYAIQDNEGGKKIPVKLGLAPVQRDDTEYEFDIVLNIARNHIATASKDVTFLDDYSSVITTELGTTIKKWLDEGAEPEVVYGENYLTKAQLNEIFLAAAENKEIATEAYKAFGYEKSIEIKYKDYRNIKKKAQELVKAQENKSEKENKKDE